MEGILSEIITLLTGGLTAMAQGIGQGLQSLATNIFVETAGETTKLTAFGALVVIFAGIALAVGLISSPLIYKENHSICWKPFRA